MTGAIFDLMPSDSKDGFGRSGSRLHSGFEIGLTNGLDAAVLWLMPDSNNHIQ